MLQALSLTAAQLSLLRSVLPSGIEAEGKVCEREPRARRLIEGVF